MRAIFQTMTTGGLIARRQIRGATTPTKHPSNEEGPPTISGGVSNSTRICRSCARAVGDGLHSWADRSNAWAEVGGCKAGGDGPRTASQGQGLNPLESMT